jgi:tyrosine aminotransferase
MSWNIKSSKFGQLTINPLRKLWEVDQPKANPNKSEIILQAGDPSAFGNFLPHPECLEALNEAIYKDKFSYDMSAGIVEARKAVADYVNKNNEGKCDITENDVIFSSGCSMAIEMCFNVLANPGENLLLPRPSWNYSTWILGSGIEARYYDLNSEKDWNVDLSHLENLIDEKTRGILINNPGNPCGNVFGKEHLLEILEIAERHKLPIIADEVYEYFTFPGVKFHSLASLSKNVPILTCSGLTKRFLIPGIRMGWLIISDRNETLKEIRKGLANIAGRNFGPNSTVQLALPRMLQNVPHAFFEETNQRVFVRFYILFTNFFF